MGILKSSIKSFGLCVLILSFKSTQLHAQIIEDQKNHSTQTEHTHQNSETVNGDVHTNLNKFNNRAQFGQSRIETVKSCGFEGCGHSHEFVKKYIKSSPKDSIERLQKQAMQCNPIRAFWIVPAGQPVNEERRMYANISLREWQQQWSSQGRTVYIENLQTIYTNYTIEQITAGGPCEYYGFCVRDILVPTVGENGYDRRAVFFLDGNYGGCAAFGGGGDWGWAGNPDWAIDGFYNNYAFDVNASNGSAGIHGHEVGHTFDLPHEDGQNGSVNCDNQCIPKGIMCNGASPSPCGTFRGYPDVVISDWNNSRLNNWPNYFNELGGSCDGPVYIGADGGDTQLTTGQEYVIRGKASNKVLTASNGNIVQQDYTGSANQRWTIGKERFGINTPDRIRYSQIINVGNGQAIDNYNYSLDAGGNIVTWGNNGQINQYWRIINRGGGDYVIQNLLSHRVMDVAGGSWDNNANIQQWRWNGGDNQLWKIEAYDPCASLGGDTDGDGICDNQDSCPNLINSLIGTSCNDGDPTTTNDIWQANCNCEGTFVPCSDPNLYGDNCDFDGDGVLNIMDEDMDNDGILNTEECPTNNVITNGSFDGPTGNSVAPPGWDGSQYGTPASTDNLSNVPFGGSYPSNIPVTSSSDGGTWVGINAYSSISPAIRQQVTLEAGTTYTISFEQANFGADLSSIGASSTGTSGRFGVRIDVGIVDPITVVGTGSNMTLGTSWNTETMSYTAQTSGIHTLELVVTNTGSVITDICYLSADNFQMVVSGGTDCDLDNDGIVNQYDTDSDDDGCLDAIEGGGNFTNQNVNGNGMLAGGVNILGIPLSVGGGQTIGNSQNAGLQDADCVICDDGDNDGICDDQDQCQGMDDSLAGISCDDNNPCTIDDTYSANCVCTGTPANDSDNDGVCDTQDNCPSLNNNLIGTSCNDGDPCTTGETYDANCGCSGGVIVDSDNDQVCDTQDNCPNLNNNLIGTGCNDGDPCTTGETYDSNCGCSGGTIVDADNDGVCDSQDICPGFNDNIDSDGDGTPDGCDNCGSIIVGGACDDGDPCTVGETYDSNCRCGGGVITDSDNDGVCDAEDQCPGFDDNRDSDRDGIPDGCDDCSGNVIGTVCDDGDPCTTGETYDRNCRCGGGVITDSDNDGVCDSEDQCPGFDDNRDSDRDGIPDGCDDCSGNVIGTACDDGDPCTTGETYDRNCRCAGGAYIDQDNDGTCAANDVDDSNPCVPVPVLSSCIAGNCTELYDINSFETGLGIWNDGGSDAYRLFNTQYAQTGSYSLRIRDNSGQGSSFYTDAMNWSNMSGAEVKFSFYANSMENGESFKLELSLNGGATYQEVKKWISGTDFNNNNTYDELVAIENISFSQNVVLRFVCDASSNGDQVYIDDVEIMMCADDDNGGASCTVGSPCNDGNDCTVGETYNNDCQCANGIYVDADNDGTCAANDVDDNNPCVPVPVLSSCGGSDCTEVYDASSFESGLGIWNDGGSDAYRLFNLQYAQTGSYSLRIRDNSGQSSSFYTDAMNWSNVSEAEVKFSFYANSMEFGESFKLELSLNGGASYQEVKSWISGTDFNNNNTYDELVAIENISFSENVVLRFVCDASSNGDQVYIDDVEIMICNSNGGGGLSCIIGGPCDDGNECTVGETYNSDCLCANGTYVDADNDGYCISDDPNDEDPCIPVSSSGCQSDGCQEMMGNNFEIDLGMWIDGGSDAYRLYNPQYSKSGDYSLRIRDNSGASSSFYTYPLDLSSYSSVILHFSYYPNSMESGESFYLEISIDGGNSFTIVEDWTSYVEFNNGNRYDEVLTISSGLLSNNVVLRFRSDASSNADQIYLDDIVLEGCGGSNLVAPQVRSRSYVNKMTLSPNPVSRLLKVVGLSSDEEIKYEIYSISGMRVGAGALENETIDVSTLVSGVYLLKVITDTDTSSEIFIKSEY